MSKSMPNEPLKKGLKDKIVEVAFAELAKKGHEGLSVREIAELCGVAKSSPNRHFASKADLLSELAVQGFQQLDQAIKRAHLPSTNLPTERLKATCKAYLQFAAGHQNLYLLMFSRGLFSPEGASKVAALKGKMLTPIRTAAAEAVAGDGPTESAGDLLGIAWALLHGLCLLMLDNQAVEQQQAAAAIAFLDRSIDTIIAGIQAQAKAAAQAAVET